MYAMALESWHSKQLVRVELATPEPRPNQVRVAVRAIGVNPVDWKMRSGGPLRLAARAERSVRGPRGPIILGVDFAGVVDALGPGVRSVALGERVFGGADFSRGQHGSYADTVVVDADQLCRVPDAVGLDVAGALPVAGATAWMALHDYRVITPGRRVLVLGASGGVGQLAVQLAKRTCGAAYVVGVCSRKNIELVRELGADAVLDYAIGDVLDAARSHGPFDVIVDCVGSYSASACRALLAPLGRHVMVAGDGPAAFVQVAVPPFRSRAILGRPTAQRLRAVIDAVAAGQLRVHIAERLPLADVERAHTLSQAGRMIGKIVLEP
jgi:NADPH:quinone reductase-like Zn-dependent oxidoreductase